MIKSIPTSNISNAAKIEFGYSNGYTRALLEVKEQLTPAMYEDMKRHKVKFNVKNVQAILDCMIENRELLRENPFAFVRCKKDGGFEVAVSK